MKTAPNLQPENLHDRLTKLVPLSSDDFDRLFEVASDPEIWSQHPAKDRYKKEVFQSFFDGAVKSGSAFLIFDTNTNALIGSTRYYDYNAEESSISIGYTFLATAYWGGAHNRSTKKMLLDYAFKFVEAVKFHIGTTNIRSQKAIEKLGARRTAMLDFDLNGVPLPHYEYEIRKQDWQSIPGL